MTIYAKYIGDEFVKTGTAEEFAKESGILVNKIREYATPSYHARHNDKHYNKRTIYVRVSKYVDVYGFYEHGELVASGTQKEVAHQLKRNVTALTYYLNKDRNGKTMIKIGKREEFEDD